MSTVSVLTPAIFAEVLSDEDKWYDLGVFLGIPLQDMDHISNNFFEKFGIRRCLFEMYKILLKQKKLDWNHIHKALLKLKNHSLADRVYNRYISPSLEPQEERQVQRHQPEKETIHVPISVPIDIQEQFEAISRMLTSLLLEVKSFCKECKADTRDVQVIIQRHWGIEPSNEKSTIADILSDERLVNECTIFDFENLKLIVSKTCKSSHTYKKKKLLEEIEAFGNIVSEFKTTVKTGHLPKLQEIKQYSSTRLGIKVEFKVQDFWRNATIAQFESVMKTVLTGLPDTPKCQMSVKSGCTCFSWIVPEAYAGRVAAVEHSETFLKVVGIISLQIGGNVVYKIKEKECETIEAAMIQAVELKISQAVQCLLLLGYPLEALKKHKGIKEVNMTVLFNDSSLKEPLDQSINAFPQQGTNISDSQRMVFDPKWFIELLAAEFKPDVLKSDENSRDWYLLKSKGILLHRLYMHICNQLCGMKGVEPQIQFMELLKQFHLAVEVNSEDPGYPEKQYFVPAVLPSYKSRVSDSLMHTIIFQAEPLHIMFASGFIVPDFFTRLSSALLKEGNDLRPSITLELYSDDGNSRGEVTYRVREFSAALGFCLVTVKERKSLTEQKKLTEVILKFFSYNHDYSNQLQEKFYSVCSDFKDLLKTRCQEVVEAFQFLYPNISKEITSFELKVVCQCQNHQILFSQEYHYLADPFVPLAITDVSSAQLMVACTATPEPRVATAEELCWFNIDKSTPQQDDKFLPSGYMWQQPEETVSSSEGQTEYDTDLIQDKAADWYGHQFPSTETGLGPEKLVSSLNTFRESIDKPGLPSTDTTVHSVLLRYRPRLLGLISDPHKLAVELMEVFPVDTQLSLRIAMIETSEMSRYDKASMINNKILRYFEQHDNDRERFLKFCQVLKDHDQAGLNELAEEMEQTV